MTAPHILNPAALLEQGLFDASPDLMGHLLATVVNALLWAEADAVCGAEYGLPSTERVNSRNGYRHRELDTRTDPKGLDPSTTLRSPHPTPPKHTGAWSSADMTSSPMRAPWSSAIVSRPGTLW